MKNQTPYFELIEERIGEVIDGQFIGNRPIVLNQWADLSPWVKQQGKAGYSCKSVRIGAYCYSEACPMALVAEIHFRNASLPDSPYTSYSLCCDYSTKSLRKICAAFRSAKYVLHDLMSPPVFLNLSDFPNLQLPDIK